MNKNIEQQVASDQAKETVELSHRGAFLKRERESRGISIESVHEATKIPLDSLRAIEEDYKIRTMTEFYYNSFMKIYAKYLGIDVSRVADQSKSAVKPKATFQEKEINFDILDKINGKLNKLTKERKRQILYVLAAILSLWLLIKFIGFIVHRKPSPSPVGTSQTSQREADNVSESETETVSEEEIVFPEGDAATPSAIPALAATTLENAGPVSDKSVVLTVRAKKESWLRVKADGNIVFQSTLNAGDVETWDAGENIEITGRNLGELEFELNGKMIGSLGRSSRRAKALVVTKDGLSVTK